MPDITLIWAAAVDANATTDYRIENDLSVPGTFATVFTQDASNRGDGAYAPFATSLNGLLASDETTITLTDATNFAEDDYIVIQSDRAREMVQLGTKAGSTFSNCLRGVGATVPQEHESGATVLNAHESYVATGVSFGSRRVIRYRIIRVQGTSESVAADLPAVSPSLPPTNNLTTIWGILQDLQGAPKSGIAVTLTINDNDNFHTDSGEMLYAEAASTTTDTDGYFELVVPRNVAHAGGGLFTLAIDPGGVGSTTWAINAVPDKDHVCFLDTA